jgi:hypothetical protein
MKILSKDKTATLQLLRSDFTSKVGNWLEKLKVGESLQIGKHEWKNRSTIYNAVHMFQVRRFKGWKFKVCIMPDRKSWLIIRTK